MQRHSPNHRRMLLCQHPVAWCPHRHCSRGLWVPDLALQVGIRPGLIHIVQYSFASTLSHTSYRYRWQLVSPVAHRQMSVWGRCTWCKQTSTWREWCRLTYGELWNHVYMLLCDVRVVSWLAASSNQMYTCTCTSRWTWKYTLSRNIPSAVTIGSAVYMHALT